ncbi:MAG: DUF2970 domain-containing protein [Pseudomonadales bacterium]|nr:DUF2970 domain-containing protein [Pseudomonadales bacterium]MCP5331571.1 DUF2970 domain-containing protein [Pseudomonadales bacterium]MCP5343454.1 DUF2970 domain-containing protein [Pseudomonadales bacterium]
MQNEDVQRKQPFWRNMLSVMQASFGVQSKKNQERDFANGSIGSFVVAALIFTTLFVLTLVVVVRSVLP